ncbi:MAG: hypothetical protein IPG43_03225 [Proteobacteria bacterium]|nr:hypothetical protein [Pseudomonadota bacterium]
MLQQLAEVGSFLGGLGVLISVGYLAHQIRLNTNSNRAASYQSAVAASAEWTRQVGLDKAATKIMMQGFKTPDLLAEEERDQFNFLLVSLVRNFENIHYQFTSGAITEETWNGWAKRIRRFFQQPGVVRWWESNSDGYSQSFQEFVGNADE